jgi:hypothetical protein|tara:strand:- start:1047 stop:1367 length:321 start_codon:yes stop_codon:yes gene_type:complete
MTLLNLIKSFFVKKKVELDGSMMIERDVRCNVIKRTFLSGFAVKYQYDLLNREITMTTTTGYREDREYRGVTHDVTRVTCRKGKRSWIEHYSIDGNKEVEYLDPEI